ncbi:hypothetical protein [Aeromonas salmonicida]|uniref:hypothetical protein n=1 Tax=Aeromonas salmonicida TaxID=645 RepID=UPI003F7C52ED
MAFIHIGRIHPIEEGDLGILNMDNTGARSVLAINFAIITIITLYIVTEYVKAAIMAAKH